MNEWSLNALCKGYYDETFVNGFKKVDTIIQRCAWTAKQPCHNNEVKALHDMLSLLEGFHAPADRIGHFISLEQPTNTLDEKTVSLMNRFSQKFSGVMEANVRFNCYMVEIEDLDACTKQDALLKEYSYLLHIIKEDSTYPFSDGVEGVLSKMNISDGEAWANLQEYLANTVEVEYRGEVSTLSQTRNTARDSDIKVRKSAYEAELRVYDKICDAVAFSLSSIKVRALTECESHDFVPPLAMTLYNVHMKQETLDALPHTMQSYVPKFHAYLRRKVEPLGYKNGLPRYELFVPLGGETKAYCIEEAKEYLSKHFHPFAGDMVDMMERAFNESWIDLFLCRGRVGGAFCANLSDVKQNRVLANYDGALSDIVAPARKPGHAYHGMMIGDHHPLNTDYSMLVAEATSTFNENITTNAVVEEAKGQEKVTLVEDQLQGPTQVICNIYPRFLFEKTASKKRKDSFMFTDELEATMIETQKQAYEDGLGPNYLHPYIWICKSHYYLSGLNFYNFPYAFGALFAWGLIAKYQEEKEALVSKYRELLKATTVSSAEDVVAMADVDLCDEAFQTSCLDTCAQCIDELLELTE